ncbi:MAG: VUT family protein [Blautia sp.]
MNQGKNQGLLAELKASAPQRALTHCNCIFIVATISMNLLANKSIHLPFSWLALDCGIIVSWIIFLCMDMITRRFGPKAATMLSVVSIAVNLGMCLVFYLGSLIPGTWGESYVDGSETVINTALNHTFGGTWYVLLGSTIAFFVSAVVNNFVNWYIGRTIKKDQGFAVYACRTLYFHRNRPVCGQSDFRPHCQP